MNTSVTVVNLIHDTATETDRPVCWVFSGCSWRENRDTSGTGTSKDPERTIHIRISASVCTLGYLPYVQWAALPAAEKRRHWTLKRGWKLVQGAVPALTEAEYAKLEKTHLCCTAAAVSDNRVGHLGQPGTAAAALACGREMTAWPPSGTRATADA